MTARAGRASDTPWLGALLALLALSCAPLPPPRTAPPPPAPRSAPPPSAPPAPRLTPAPARFSLDREPEIDVGLAWDLDSLTLEPRHASRVTLFHPGRGQDLEEDVLDLHVTSAGTIRARLASDQPALPLLATGDTLWVGGEGAGSLPSEDRTTWNGRTWRGRCKVFRNPRGNLTLALRLPLETYLAGVVPGELGGLTGPILEAGRAQAIAARSYTLFYRGRRADEGFDVYGTVEDQFYGSSETERPLATRCVESTHGRVALAEGSPIRANYCSTCGGMTAEAWEAWPTAPYSYLVSQRDRGRGTDHCATSGHYRWREVWSAAEFMANVARFAPELGIPLPARGAGELRDVRVESRSRSGRVWRLSISSTTGEIDVSAYSLRQLLRRGGNPSAILRSNLFKIAVRRERTSGKALSVVASGAGSGHGVGLCQTGAIQMAREGASDQAILEHYYPGVTIKRLY